MRKKNLQIGSRNMTLLNLLDAKAALTMAGLKATVPLVVKPLLTGSMASVVTALVFVIAELALRFYLGEISGWELAMSVMISALMAGAASFIVTGLIMGIALAFPVLLPFFQIVMVPLAVAGLVFIPIQISSLVNGWWTALDQKGHLDHFIAGLHLFKAIVQDVSESRLIVRNGNTWGLRSRISEAWSNLTSRIDLSQHVPRVDIIEFISELGQEFSDADLEFAWLESFGGAIAGTSHRAVEVLPDWQLAVPSWKFDVGLGRFTPDFGLLERLPALDMDLKVLLADVGMPSLRKLTVPLPDFGVANQSAQDAHSPARRLTSWLEVLRHCSSRRGDSHCNEKLRDRLQACLERFRSCSRAATMWCPSTPTPGGCCPMSGVSRSTAWSCTNWRVT